ncbi:integrase [Variovorax boronicumulans]|uniref:Integrase n=1 Tax=Variovorax boronicumulans TaxID=436515 RepID=A0A250DGL1_9BURK|nr:site-specific integrase [Variovorax boronicumulans]ATA53113.1 integrase [Variovorax boronicumulans]
MRLVFSTDNFVYGGRVRPGFPLILNDEMKPAQPFHSYLRFRLLEQGRALDIKTWEAYGRRLWDFSRFLHDNDLAWDKEFSSYGASVIRAYRDWQVEDLCLEPSTVNDRLKVVGDFYCWAHTRGLVRRIPFVERDVVVRGVEHDFAHLTGGRMTIGRSDLLVDEWTKEPVFLTAEQIQVARSTIRATPQRILFDLMCRVGLRAVEARTFPLAYVFDPAKRVALDRGALIDVPLHPRDMELKFKKPRVVHVPYGLMEEMHAYSQFERNCRSVGSESKALLLTACGNAYSKGSAYKAMRDLGRKVGFNIRPLMLRHSYAIHTLLLLRSRPDIKLEPLMYIRDRLGHRSVHTTMVYLKQIERLLGAEALAMLEEFDRMYEVGPALRASNQRAIPSRQSGPS